jgi:nitrilase
VIVMPVSTVAALQIGSLPGGKAETLEQILSYEDEILRSGAQLVVMPEALLGGYPKGEGFGTQLGYRLPEGREAFARYFANAIDVPGVETEALAGLSARTGASLVMGVI